MMFSNSVAKIDIGTMEMPSCKKPCLVVREGNHIRKVATFVNEMAAITFVEKMAAFLELPDPYGFKQDDKEGGDE